MRDLAQLVREDLRVVVDLGVVGLTDRDREDLVVGLPVVDHGEQPDRSRLHEAPREGRLGDEDQHVERVVVEGERPWYETVIAGIIHRRVQRPVQLEDVERLIIFVFISRAARDFDDDVDLFRCFFTERQQESVLTGIESHALAFPPTYTLPLNAQRMCASAPSAINIRISATTMPAP